MTKEEIKAALIAGETLVSDIGSERSLDDIVGHMSSSTKWKIKPRTITVNGVEVPEPLRVEPKLNDMVWAIYSDGPLECSYSDAFTIEFNNGAIHSTKEAAQAHYDALWLPSRVKS